MASDDSESPVDVTVIVTPLFRCKMCEFHAVSGNDITRHLCATHSYSHRVRARDAQDGTYMFAADSDSDTTTSERGEVITEEKIGSALFARRSQIYYESLIKDLAKRLQVIFSQIQMLESVKCLPQNQIDMTIYPSPTACVAELMKEKSDSETHGDNLQIRSELANVCHKVVQLRKKTDPGLGCFIGDQSSSIRNEQQFKIGDGDPHDSTGSASSINYGKDRSQNTGNLVLAGVQMSKDGQPSEGDEMHSGNRSDGEVKGAGASPTPSCRAVSHKRSVLTGSRDGATGAKVHGNVQPVPKNGTSEPVANARRNHEPRTITAQEHVDQSRRTMLLDTSSGSGQGQTVLAREGGASAYGTSHPATMTTEEAPEGGMVREEETSDKKPSNTKVKSVEGPTASFDISKLLGKVDFQEIAQQASRSNPDATTITVVKHTGSNGPPTTIHFKKSRKSNAIIPTGESLGITSPFLHKGYAGSKIFACKECHSRYKTQNELERHTAKKHVKKKSYLCEICGDALATPSGMKIHINRKHASSPIQTCDVCDYVTRSAARFKIHQRKHNIEKSEYHCKPCKKSFVTESKLQQHRNSPMHKNAVDPIICEHCGYVTKKRDNFLVHLRKHTGEKPYKCRHCNYAAADGSTLKRHVMARHSSIRPFRCSRCQFSCVDKKGLTVHMRKHTGERPYTCDQCPYSAKRVGALTVHQRTHLRHKSASAPSMELGKPGETEVASYVDISNIPFTEHHSESSYVSPLASQEAAVGMVRMAADPAVTAGRPLADAVQIPAGDDQVQEATSSVRSMGVLWQTMT